MTTHNLIIREAGNSVMVNSDIIIADLYAKKQENCRFLQLQKKRLDSASVHAADEQAFDRLCSRKPQQKDRRRRA